MRVGVNLGSADEEAKAAKVAVTMHETMVRSLNLIRLVAGLQSSCWAHQPCARLCTSRLASDGSKLCAGADVDGKESHGTRQSLPYCNEVIVGAPVVVQSCFIHSVDLPSWIIRLLAPCPAMPCLGIQIPCLEAMLRSVSPVIPEAIYAVVGVVGTLVAPASWTDA